MKFKKRIGLTVLALALFGPGHRNRTLAAAATVRYPSFTGDYLCPQPKLAYDAPMRLKQDGNGRLSGGVPGLYEIKQGVAAEGAAIVTLHVLAFNPHVAPGDYVVVQDMAVAWQKEGLHFEGRGFRLDCRRAQKADFERAWRKHRLALAPSQVQDCETLLELLRAAQRTRRAAGVAYAPALKEMFPLKPPLAPRLVRFEDHRFFCASATLSAGAGGYTVRARPLGELKDHCELVLSPDKAGVVRKGACRLK